MLLEAATAGSVVSATLTDLSSNVGTIIPAALGVAALVFGAGWLWRKVKGLIS